MQNRMTYILAVVAAALLAGACSNDAPRSEKIRVDLRALQMQLGITAGAPGIDAPKDSAATDAVQTIVVGPLLHNAVGGHGKPYSLETEAWTDEVKKEFEKDVVNSGSFLKFIQMPTTEEFAEFNMPEVTSGNWQVIAAASRNTLKTAGDLENEDNKEALVYYGITEETFLNADAFNNANVTLNMQRACLVKAPNTPKGCATYNKYKEAAVTAAVEIIGVRVNVATLDESDPVMDYVMAQPAATWTFPIIVRDNAAGGTAVTPDEAKTRLNNLRSQIEAYVVTTPTGTITRLTVFTTHRENPAESAACRGLMDLDGVSTYRANCEVQKYFYRY